MEITTQMVAAYLAWDLNNKNSEMGDLDVAFNASNDDENIVELEVGFYDPATNRRGSHQFTLTVR
jgi:hypothetical protein